MNSEKIGLLPGFGWVANQAWLGDSWWSQLLSMLLTCWLITPVGHIVWAFIAQTTIVPLDSKRQWRSFFPGDLFLGGAIAVLIFAATRVPFVEARWWQSTTFHLTVLGGALFVATVMTVVIDKPAMPLAALLSPSKLYHNFVLYGGYGYIGVVSLVAAVASNWGRASLWLVVLAVIVGSPWVRYVVLDGQLSKEEASRKQEHAHPASYRLFWIIPIRGKY